ncbi:P1 family peptidase [Nonomuraea sp. NPDC059194]|uniref:P1 family peptidase n=1 Tax=Nonomuraea sp. NPDC059194 TaxID=3346764 RepID=UPI0036CE3DF1
MPEPPELRGAPQQGEGSIVVVMLADAHITPLFDAVVEATEKATEETIVNALVAADTMTGRDGVTTHGLDGRRLSAPLT